MTLPEKCSALLIVPSLALWSAYGQNLASQVSKPVAHIQLTVLALATASQVGESKPLSVSVENISNQALSVPLSPGNVVGLDTCNIDLFSQDGKPVDKWSNRTPTQTLAPGVMRRRGGSRRRIPINAGDSLKIEIDLQQIFSFKSPGTYKLQVSMVDPVTHELVKSNVVTLNLVSE